MSVKRRVFVDTNVLVYAYDRSEPYKQAVAFNLLEDLIQRDAGLISTQVLAEFFVSITRKLEVSLSPGQAYESIKNYLLSWAVADMNSLIVLEAARGVCEHQFNFWDAQIWATARLNQCQIVLSEDFNNGAIIEGVRFTNPFVENFSLTDWL